MFDSFRIAGSGVTAHRKWLDAVSDNLANMNNVSRTDEAAFQERFVVARAATDLQGNGNGVEVAGIALGSAEGRLVSDPTHPLADANGMVRRPDMDLTGQMTNLIMAQRGYQANIAAAERARDAYEAALALGRQ
jgi:flagellar basal-body rod protein FlgC